MDVTIRHAWTTDAEAMTALCLRSKRSNGYDDAFMAACAAELAVTPARLRDERFHVAERSGGIVGCAGLVQGGTTGEVVSFFVDPDHQGHGIGRLLWKALLDEAQRARLHRLHLDADPAAEGFYRQLGFATVGRSPSGSIPGRTLPFMERHLAVSPPAPPPARP